MKVRSALLTAALILFVALPRLHARPLLTEEVPTIGDKAFEVSLSLSRRTDDFSSPTKTYQTVNTPLSARVGFGNNLDIGFYLNYVRQRLETTSAHFSGSQNGRFSPFFKVSPWRYLGFQFFWHTKTAEQGVQDLPIARGTDEEALALLKLPVVWPVSFNVGYVFRGGYKSKLGISNDIAYKVEPGDIFEAKGAIEVPLKLHLSLLGELAYYRSQQTRIENVAVPDSAATAMDALAGITWAYEGWNFGAGAAFGLLNERYTSFDLERGAGDVTYKLTASYRLVARKPDR